MTNNPTPDLTELELREQLYGAMDGNLRMSLRRKLLDGYREAILASVQTEPAAVSSPPATDRAALRDRIADTVTPFLANFSDEETAKANAGEVADAVLAVLPPPADRAAVYRWAADDLDAAFGDPMVTHIGKLGASHLRRRAREIEAGSGQTGEGQPETPLEKRLRFSERRNDELRAECKRRGKIKLEQAETIAWLERQLDEVRTQLGAEILRAGQAEAELRHVADEAQQPDTETRVVAYRAPGSRTLYCLTCALQETGWQPVTDADEQAVCDFCGGRVHAVAAQTLGAVVARYLPGATPAAAPFVPSVHYRRDDGVDCCVHATPVGPDSCRHCQELAADAPAVVSQPGKET